MTQLLPLILVWLFANNKGTAQAQASLSRRGAPPWPTPTSPPPMPAFQPQPSAHDASTTATPLAALHNAPPKVRKPTTEPAHLSTPNAIKQNAIKAFKKKSTSLLKKQLSSRAPNLATKATSSLSSLFHKSSAPSATTVSVANLQKILAQRGYKLVQDGLYGPKTAAAWAKAAKSKGLPSNIARASGTTAKVAARAYDALSVPPIP